MKRFAPLALLMIALSANATKPTPKPDSQPPCDTHKQFCPGCPNPAENGCGIYAGL